MRPRRRKAEEVESTSLIANSVQSTNGESERAVSNPTKKQRKTKAEVESPQASSTEAADIANTPSEPVSPPAGKQRRKTTKKDKISEAEKKEATESKSDNKEDTPVKKKRKSKDSEPEMPLRLRNPEVKMLIGAHVSMAKSIANSVTNANHIGANSFAMFLKNQRKWVSPAMPAEDIKDFKGRLEGLNYDARKQILPHGSYLINLAQEDAAKQLQAYECFLDDLKRCEILDIGRYNFHPGSSGSSTKEKGIKNVAACINKAIRETKFVRIVIENMAGHGNVIGGPLEELAQIIEQIENKSRVGVCLDTCRRFHQ